jgi:hypothetical protein
MTDFKFRHDQFPGTDPRDMVATHCTNCVYKLEIAGQRLCTNFGRPGVGEIAMSADFAVTERCFGKSKMEVDYEQGRMGTRIDWPAVRVERRPSVLGGVRMSRRAWGFALLLGMVFWAAFALALWGQS